MDEELESLREKSTRASTVYDDLETGETSVATGVSRFTPAQRLILALLLLLDVLALVLLVLVLTETITLF